MGTTQTKEKSIIITEAEIETEDEIKQAGRNGVDVCFMLDCTGSMSMYIQMACNKIKEMTDQTKEQYPESPVRIGIVAYRDVQDSPRFEILSFTQSIEKAHQFLGKLEAHGGGDTPEDVNGAFQKTLFSMNWISLVRLVVHIADAPCHGKDFHDYDDTHPQGWKEDMDWDKIFTELVEKRLDYLFLKISSNTDKMHDKFKSLAEKNGSIKAELNFEMEQIVDPSQAPQNQHFGCYGGFGGGVLAPHEEEEGGEGGFSATPQTSHASQQSQAQVYAETQFVQHVTKSIQSGFEKRLQKRSI